MFLESLIFSLVLELLAFCIGFRLFEIKFLYLEFLDIFCVIFFIKVEDLVKKSILKFLFFLMLFVEYICLKEFDDLDKVSKLSDVKINLVVMLFFGRMSKNLGFIE